jgi:biotin carboxylase
MEGKKKLAIIGAALFQEPAIIKAKEMGLETHVFAWATGDRGEELADYFYPVSIRERDEILRICREIGIDGIVSIASDLAMETVNYVAAEMGLPGNSLEATRISTNKHWMRKAFEENGDPSPRSIMVDMATDPSKIDLEFPLIVKPTDRSGSRGVHKVYNVRKLRDAVFKAREYSFEKKVVVEEFVEGDEYSIEYISYQGQHWFLSATQKLTTGAPYFIETGHREPAPLSDEVIEKIKAISEHALDTLQLREGAAHIELKVNGDDIKLIEIGGRMGGDFIGSDLVYLSTGYDFVKAVIEVALGVQPEIPDIRERHLAGVDFIFNEEDAAAFEQFKKDFDGTILRSHVDSDFSESVTDSSNRHGYYIWKR